ncbi:M56 family metallopeptidase [Winogradskyella marincola]|uniref:M56 family metallopeptidase n=1 Tax=Winogradskyella marincola TaxID=3037795 RepID=A0ABT6G1Q2_9FLAO|nr:M56 family metallopeptidase [Winogradskyella sp. YYF002]MDG4715923.1 M56 family metallopeptidase [Winogradskyella sp. YYF002]
MLYSIIQIVLFQTLFLLVYDLFLRRETFFNYNRIYLLLTSVFSIVLPFVKLPELRKVTTQETVIRLPEVFIGDGSNIDANPYLVEQINEAAITNSQLPIWQIVLYIGVVLAALVFIVKIAKLYFIKNNNPKRWKGNILIVNLLKSSAAFSFFNTVFLGDKIPSSERNTIYEHELVHVKEKHSVDLLFFEVLRILFWFSPLVYMYQSRVKELHEFIADAKAVKHQGKSSYYQSLLHQILDTNSLSFTNTFFKKSLIKKRIIMLQKSKSSQKNLFKYALLLPVIFAMLVYTSTEVKAQEKSDAKTEMNQELTDEELLKIYYNDILEMEKKGIKFYEISKYVGFDDGKSNDYIQSREDYLKISAFMRYMVKMMKDKKSESNELSDESRELYKKMYDLPHKSYQGYLEWKKTDEAKRKWESYTGNGTLKLFVEDMANKTQKEQKRFDDLMNQLNKDKSYYKLIVTDGKSTFVIDSPLYETETETELLEVPFHVIDQAPSHKECVNLISEQDKKECFSEFVNAHVKKNFNTKVETNAELHKKRIFARFLIDADGNVTRIQARAASKVLEEEAMRVLSLLPQFIPGRQKDKAVAVAFSLPIVLTQK